MGDKQKSTCCRGCLTTPPTASVGAAHAIAHYVTGGDNCGTPAMYSLLGWTGSRPAPTLLQRKRTILASQAITAQPPGSCAAEELLVLLEGRLMQYFGHPGIVAPRLRRCGRAAGRGGLPKFISVFLSSVQGCRFA